ncbi:sugar phosphate isomerase/epimerase [Rubellimicrobium sp. CFH 75288]|uniref:sugar phosphate isomerase/epimerase family protein n=1 Tax=Rubellimicrobium sp. CFH 75288 TaxID=2697034 RepID=UPI00141303AD|nr:TIM barrel protein [Rubellimicrobium sp. CFH 75288]NAZ35453.1 TIM barrel protein [Rubellimicrobium sp. CFH 75288]
MRRDGYRHAYATRLNAFRADAARAFPGRNRIGTAELLARAATVPGLSAVDLNFPDHLDGLAPGDVAAQLAGHGLGLNGFAMRYGADPAFRGGALAHPDPALRARAVDLTRRGLDALLAAGGSLLTIWPGQDGFEYPLATDYGRAWDALADSLARIAAHAPEAAIALEPKPDEPRARALLRDSATALLLVAEVGAPNLGVTLDVAHALYAGETPAEAATLIARRSRLLGVHLNDGYGRRDDGLVTGSVHPLQILDLLLALDRIGYRGPLYFDTFPDAAGLDPVRETALNIAAAEALTRALDRLKADPLHAEAVARGDALAALGRAQAALFGAG